MPASALLLCSRGLPAPGGLARKAQFEVRDMAGGGIGDMAAGIWDTMADADILASS